MKKFNELFLTILFFSIILTAFVMFFFLKSYENVEINYEKRALTEKPIFNIENVNNYGSEYESYFNDHFPHRNELILANKNIKYELFQYVEGDVIVGKDQWLFFNPKVGENTLNDYQGKDLFSENELEDFKNSLLFSNSILSNKNIDFYILFAPNKNRVYAEYFPDEYGKPAENYKLKQVIDYLNQETDIKTIYTYDELMKSKSILSDKTIYHQYDTHWNKIGGYVGAWTFLSKIGIDIPYIDSDDFDAKLTKGQLADLAYMAGLYNLLEKDIDYELSYKNKNSAEKILDQNGEIVVYKNEKPIDNRKILFISDSYAEMLHEPIADQFKESYFISYLVFNQDMIKEYKPDIVVFETLERTMANRLKFFAINDIG